MDWKAFDDESCFMVCLYGIALDKAEIVPLVGEVAEFLRATGQAPTHLLVEGRGFGGKPLLFDRTFKRLQMTTPENLVSVELFSLMEDWHTLSDWIATSNIDLNLSYFHFGTGMMTMPDAEQRIMGFVRRWLDRIQPAYGIGFYRTRGRGPGAYGIGLAYGYRGVYDGPEYEEMGTINRWSDGMDEAVYDQGVLRDVFPYSLLTTRHLEREVVDGCPLEDWIEAQPWRGKLAACQDGYTLWTVEREHLTEVRRQLASSGALYVLDRDNHL